LPLRNGTSRLTTTTDSSRRWRCHSIALPTAGIAATVSNMPAATSQRRRRVIRQRVAARQPAK
jgi:hypothetical protein